MGSLSSKYASVLSDLKTYHPVIFTGTTGILNASNAYIWVGDGYSSLKYEYESTYYDENVAPHCYCAQYSRTMISMNWGWAGDSNGFFIANYVFSVNGDTYDTYLRALTGIRP